MTTPPLEPAAAKLIGLWVVGDGGGEPGASERLCRAYADARGWQVREVYRPAAEPPDSPLDHSEAHRMLQDARTGRIEGLVAARLADIARNRRELLRLTDSLRATRTDLAIVQEAIDTTAPEGRSFYAVVAAMAEWERQTSSERVGSSLKQRAQLGQPLGGAAPFGYRWENRTLVLDPDEAPVRRLIFDLYLEHGAKKTVARILNEAGHRTRRGAAFSDTTIDRLLRDPTAKGWRCANRRQGGEGDRGGTTKPESEWAWIAVEPIVSPEVWERANRMLQERSETPARPRRTG